MKKTILKFSLVIIFAAATWQAPGSPCMSSYGHLERAGLQNPFNPVLIAYQVALYRALLWYGLTNVHTAEGDSALVQYPSVFTEYNYSQMNDDRVGGMDTVTNTWTLGMDFMTVGDIFVGGMVSFSDYDGDNDNKAKMDGNNLTYTLYASKALSENMFAGLSLSYSDDDDKAADVDTSTYSVTPYVSFVTYLDEVQLSITPAYMLAWSETEALNPTDDKSHRQELLLSARATMGVTEALSVFAGATAHQVVYSRLMDGENGQDHFWVATSVGFDWMINEMVAVRASVGYDAFNKNYRKNLNAQAGLTVLF